MNGRPIVVVAADRVAEVVESLPVGAVVVVCDPDGGRAADVAARVTKQRTAVFAGDLADPGDREAIAAFCIDMLGGSPDQVLGPDPVV